MRFSEPMRIRGGGSRDGAGAGDHDEPYTFGHRPTVSAPFPFSTRELARLLILRVQLAHRGGDASLVGTMNQILAAGADQYPSRAEPGLSPAPLDCRFTQAAV
jgi:hypothetical protein